MDEMNNKNIKPAIARTGAGSKPVATAQPKPQKEEPAIEEPATEAPAKTAAAAAASDAFAQAYQQHKQEVQAANEEVITVSDRSAEDNAKKKFNTILVVLIILTASIFTASCATLFMGLIPEKSAPVYSDDNDVIPEENIFSATLSTPFAITNPEFTEYPAGIQEKYKALYMQNQDFVGWLTVPGTSIDTPVYQASNNDYYLKHDNYDTYTKYGIPFLDMYCGVETLSRNSTIYGHNFDNGLIFDHLHKYQDIEFFKENPIIEFNTLYKDYKWKIIAAFHTNGSSDGDNGYLFYYIAANMGNRNFMEFYDELQQRSYIHTGVDVNETDKILTLSTCTYFFDRNGKLENARFAVVARLVREGESTEIDPTLAKANDNVRYPQLYYTVFGGKNPYKNATQWEAGDY